MKFTGIVEPGAYQLDDFVAWTPPDNATVFIHLPTHETWSAEMIDAVFPFLVPDTPEAPTTVVHVAVRRVFG